MTVLAQALSRSLIHFVWQGSLIGVLLSLALSALRNRSANVRYAVSCAALAMLAIVPLMTVVLLSQPVSQHAASTDPVSVAVATGRSSASPSLPVSGWLESVQAWALPVWSSGVLVFSLRL